MGVVIERTQRGLLLQTLYPLHGKVPGLRHVPLSVRRHTRRALTGAGVRLHLARCRGVTVAAVTGSMGKTTTKDLLAEMLATAGPTVKTRKNDNGLYGVPASLLSIRSDDRFAVIEVGIETTPGEMAWMASLFRPRVAILTGIGDDHTSAYGSREAVAREKRALLERVAADGVAVVNADDPLARAAADGLRCRVILAGLADDADVQVTDVRVVRDGLAVAISTRVAQGEASVRLHGAHLAPLVALAAGAAEALGVQLATALHAAASFAPAPGRMELAPGPNGSTFLLDYYKSRPAIAVAAVRALAQVPAQRHIAVVGEVQDHPHVAETYRPLADALRACADRVVAVGRSGPLLRELLGDDANLAVVERADEAAALLRGNLRAGDAVLVHGAARQHLQRTQLLLDGAAVGCRVRRCTFHWLCTDCPYLVSGPPPSAVEAA